MRPRPSSGLRRPSAAAAVPRTDWSVQWALSARARAMAPIKACSEETCGFCLSAMANGRDAAHRGQTRRVRDGRWDFLSCQAVSPSSLTNRRSSWAGVSALTGAERHGDRIGQTFRPFGHEPSSDKTEDAAPHAVQMHWYDRNVPTFTIRSKPRRNGGRLPVRVIWPSGEMQTMSPASSAWPASRKARRMTRGPPSDEIGITCRAFMKGLKSGCSHSVRRRRSGWDDPGWRSTETRR